MENKNKLYLIRTNWDGVWRSGQVWTLRSIGDQDVNDIMTWFWLPLPLVRLSCIIKGYGWVPVKK